MSSLDAKSLRLLLEASEILHSHAHGSFHERLFRAARLLFSDEGHTFEMYDANSHCLAAHTDLPFDDKQRDTVLHRIAELVPTQNPMYEKFVSGVSQPLRLSDFVSQRQFKRRDLYHDVFVPADVRFQMAIPLITPTAVGGLTVNLRTRDFSDAHLELADLFGRQAALAYETDRLLRDSMGSSKRFERKDHTNWRRLGLSRRECEVLLWVAEGKRDHETAIILGLSPRTVEGHVSSILRKLGVETRTAAVRMALRGFEN